MPIHSPIGRNAWQGGKRSHARPIPPLALIRGRAWLDAIPRSRMSDLVPLRPQTRDHRITPKRPLRSLSSFPDADPPTPPDGLILQRRPTLSQTPSCREADDRWTTTPRGSSRTDAHSGAPFHASPQMAAGAGAGASRPPRGAAVPGNPAKKFFAYGCPGGDGGHERGTGGAPVVPRAPPPDGGRGRPTGGRGRPTGRPCRRRRSVHCGWSVMLATRPRHRPPAAWPSDGSGRAPGSGGT